MNSLHVAFLTGLAVYLAGCGLIWWWNRRHDDSCVCGRCEWRRLEAAIARACANDRKKVTL